MFSQYIGDIDEFPALGSSSPQNPNSNTNKPTYTSIAAAQPKSPSSADKKGSSFIKPHTLEQAKKRSLPSPPSTKAHQKSTRNSKNPEPKGFERSVNANDQHSLVGHNRKEDEFKFNRSPPPMLNEEEEEQYGLMGLLGVLRMINSDQSMLALGSDLSNLGLNLNMPSELYSTFLSPWTDTQATPRGIFVEQGFFLPQCYQNVAASPPDFDRMEVFSDETLFYIFYSTPMDKAQGAAGRELQRRNWRYNKELGLWITRGENNNQPFGRPVSGTLIEEGEYALFDPEKWKKVEKDYIVRWDEMAELNIDEEETLPLSAFDP